MRRFTICSHCFGRGSRSNTFPFFLIVGKGYTWHVDYWSLGICVFELIFGRRPFESRSADKLTQAIMKGSIKFPSGTDDKCSTEGQNLVLAVGVVSLSPFVMDPFFNAPHLVSSSIGIPRRGSRVRAESGG